MKNIRYILSVVLLCLFFQTEEIKAQDFPPQISDVELQQLSTCDQLTLDVSFNIRHGFDMILLIPYNFVRFTTSSTFTVTLRGPGMEPVVLGSFQPSQVPGIVSIYPSRVNHTFDLPIDLPTAPEYFVTIQSSNPAAGPVHSRGFEVEPPPPITNNEIVLKEPETGTVSGSARRGSVLRLQAPQGTVFSEVIFASFGNPSGSEGQYQHGLCHYPETKAVVESLVLGEAGVEIPVGDPLFPSEFGLICELLNLFNMRLAVTLRYDEIQDQSGGTILGSTPQNGNGFFNYQWEMSTSGPDSGFEPAPGVSNEKDYQYQDVRSTTWFRRVVYNGRCRSTSNVIEVKIQENVWTGQIDRDWNNVGNWSLNTIPDEQTSVIIPLRTNQPQISEGANAKVLHLQVEQGAQVSIEENWLQIAGDLQGMGALDAHQGSVAWVGDTPQEIPAGIFRNGSVENILIRNIAGVKLLGNLDVTGVIKVDQGILQSEGKLTLRSTQDGTAMVDGSGKGTIQGEVTTQRYYSQAFGYRYISSPVKNIHIEDLVPFVNLIDPQTGFPHVYKYEEGRESDTGEDLTGWEQYTQEHLPLEPMRGYAINFGNQNKPQVLEFKGELHDGPYSLNLENHQGTYTNGFHLVGNPYFSPIDWDSEQGWEKINIDDAIYFFVPSPSDPYAGSYTSYVNKISSRMNPDNPIATNIIPAMQGFFVHVSRGSGSQVTKARLVMNNRVRTTTQSPATQDNKTMRVMQNMMTYTTDNSSSRPIVRLNLEKTGSILKDPVVIYFQADASEGFDQKLDALKLMNTDTSVPNFYSLTRDGNPLSINALSLDNSADLQKIPLELKVGQGGTYSIELEVAEGLPGNLNLYLIDLHKRISLNLYDKSVYTFEVPEGVTSGRFELQVARERPRSSAAVFNESFSVRHRSGDIIVHLNLEADQKGQLYLSNISGQVIEQAPASGTKEVRFTSIPVSGVYFVTLELQGSQETKKVLIEK